MSPIVTAWAAVVLVAVLLVVWQYSRMHKHPGTRDHENRADQNLEARPYRGANPEHPVDMNSTFNQLGPQ